MRPVARLEPPPAAAVVVVKVSGAPVVVTLIPDPVRGGAVAGALHPFRDQPSQSKYFISAVA